MPEHEGGGRPDALVVCTAAAGAARSGVFPTAVYAMRDSATILE